MTLAQLNLPSEQFWGGQRALLWVGVVILACFICYDAARSVNYAVQATRIREYDNDVRASLSAAVSQIVSVTGVPWDEVTVRYYCRRPRLSRARLVQVGAVLAGADLIDAQIAVVPGVGVAGIAFDEQVCVIEEWRQFARAATRQGREPWEKRSKRDRYGLNWGQLRRSPQPEGVLAAPTFSHDGQPNGCILVSGRIKLSDLEGDDMADVVNDLTTVLDVLGSPPAGWWGAHAR
ncbi:hypothetical protein [Micromonospora arida]|uniref:hypothetical protein n=1 Tax=Micromonospora arida TaxID=2203715 RepID=UPI003CE9CBC9